MKTKKLSKRLGAIITMSCLSVVAVALGAGLGFYLHGMTAKQGDHTAVVTGNNDELLNTYGAVISDDESVDFTKLVDTNVFTCSDIANISLMLMKKKTNYMTQGKGYAKGGPVIQQIRDTVIRDGDDYMEESISASSMVKTASRTFQGKDKKDDKGYVDVYDGVPVDGDVEKASYEKKSTRYKPDAYFKKYGRTLDTPIIYIISDSTVNPSATTESGDPATSLTKTKDGYTLELELAANGSTTNYQVQMIAISNLSSIDFSFVHLTFYLDSKLQLIATESHEKYTVTLKVLPVPTTTEGRLTTKYFCEGGYTIPELETPITYWGD
ncbi:MAG: hypothetical protein LKK13_03925 [Bacilli bacterium]|jgi:hypothetical protein|nr:hypothetical protein [Bacilli bacterium]